MPLFCQRLLFGDCMTSPCGICIKMSMTGTYVLYCTANLSLNGYKIALQIIGSLFDHTKRDVKLFIQQNVRAKLVSFNIFRKNVSTMNVIRVGAIKILNGVQYILLLLGQIGSGVEYGNDNAKIGIRSPIAAQNPTLPT